MTLEWPGCRSRNQSGDGEPWMLPVPVHIVTNSAQLPVAFLQPNSDQSLVIGFDCEGVDLARYGRLCIMQVCSLPTSSPNALCIYGASPVSMVSQSVLKFVVCEVICNSSWSFQTRIWDDPVGKQVHPNLTSSSIFTNGSWHLMMLSTWWTQWKVEMHWCKHVSRLWSHSTSPKFVMTVSAIVRCPSPLVNILLCLYCHFYSK